MNNGFIAEARTIVPKFRGPLLNKIRIKCDGPPPDSVVRILTNLQMKVLNKRFQRSAELILR